MAQLSVMSLRLRQCILLLVGSLSFGSSVGATCSLVWTTEANMPAYCSNFSVASLGATIYAIGGVDSVGATDMVEAYDPATNTWKALANRPSPVEYPEAVSV